eukprot:scaffold57779_cov30-Tisochrysis_lutea.AAC.6
MLHAILRACSAATLHGPATLDDWVKRTRAPTRERPTHELPIAAVCDELDSWMSPRFLAGEPNAPAKPPASSDAKAEPSQSQARKARASASEIELLQAAAASAGMDAWESEPVSG